MLTNVVGSEMPTPFASVMRHFTGIICPAFAFLTTPLSIGAAEGNQLVADRERGTHE